MSSSPQNTESPVTNPSTEEEFVIQNSEQELGKDEEIVRITIPKRKRPGFSIEVLASESGSNPRIKKNINPAPSRKKQTRSNSPRSHIRGIHHAAPIQIYIGALITTLFYFSLIVIFLDFIAFALTFEVGVRDLLALSFLFIMSMLFITAARSCHCGICKASFFYSGKLNRHALSHSLPFLGKNLPTALHTLFLFWLRCPACGTPTRLLGRSKE